MAQEQASGIIGGVDAGESDFPWISALIKKGNFSAPAVIGGGVLIADQWVLTAAHSVAAETPDSVELWFRVKDLSNTDELIQRNVLAIYEHPDFENSGGISTNDLALLLLDRPLTEITPVPLIESGEPLFPDDPVSTAGWGTISAGVTEPHPVLQKCDLELVTRMSANPFFGNALTVAHLPARDSNAVATPCFGDSGGPLVKVIEGTETLVGLVSFGSSDCSDASVPAVFVNVHQFLDWIDDYLELTSEASGIKVTGKGKEISNGDLSPRRRDNTYFGKFRVKKRKVSRTFYVQNAGAGLLTVRAVTASGSRFRVKKAPVALINESARSSCKIQFRSPRRKSRKRSTVRLYTNDPVNPVYRFRVKAKIR
ncbi:MAG: serine protease [Verrucomicrobiales bacterium]|nr:serine protease [Verrucomicrobiales bacterium]